MALSDIVKVQKEKCDEQNIYAKININAMCLAMKDLTPAQFEVWLYFAKNQQGHIFTVSPAAALNQTGIKKDTFQRAKRALKEKGYLVNNPEKGENYYTFYEIPPEDEIMYVIKA